jgi:hypothetical protein
LYFLGRFAEASMDGKGYDRVRRTEIGKKNFKLTHFEEVCLVLPHDSICDITDHVRVGCILHPLLFERCWKTKGYLVHG